MEKGSEKAVGSDGESEGDKDLKSPQFVTIREGKAEILFPSSNEVFYNPVQEFNRDLSTAVLRLFSEEAITKDDKTKRKKAAEKGCEEKVPEGRGQCYVGGSESAEDDDDETKISIQLSSGNDARPQMGDTASCKDHPGITILEGLAASGLRSIRYALEVNNVKKIVANDISEDAVKLMRRNIQHNKVSHLVSSSKQDASLLMYQHRHPVHQRFNAVDLDPYGTAAPFLDSAVQCVSDGGILLVTCTDMAGLCGNHAEAAYAKYGGMPLKAKFCHEMALRVVLASLSTHASKYKRYIVPLLSMSVDFYIRVFVQVFTSPSEVKRTASKHSVVFNCTGCGDFHLMPMGRRLEVGDSKKYPATLGPPVGSVCEECNSHFHFGGPMWSEPIHDKVFLQKLLNKVKSEADLFNTSDRIIGLLSMALEELDEPLYYTIENLAGTLHSSMPSLIQFRSAIIGLGYKVSGSHACPTAIKTNAPGSVIWDIMRCWVKQHPVKKKNHTPANNILSKEPKHEASFDIKPEANPMSRKQKLLRYQENPQDNWGPKARAKKKGENSDTLEERRLKNQGKRKQREERDLKQFPCKRLKYTGTCELGDECKYSHEVETASQNRPKADEQIDSSK